MTRINRSTGIGLAVTALLAGCGTPHVAAEPPATAPAATPPATTPPAATQPAAPPIAEGIPGVDAEAWDMLRRLEAEGKDLQQLTARLTYDKVQGIFGQEQRRFGNFWYRPRPVAPVKPPARANPQFAVRFDGLRIGGRGKPLNELEEWYIFDGRWLLERDDRKQNATRRELVAADEPIDLLSTDGLPLPLQIDANEIAERFTVSVQRDDAEAVVLELIPRRRNPEKGAQSVELTFSRGEDGQPLTPYRVLIREAGGDQTTVTLNQVDRAGGLPEGVFDTQIDRRAMRGWDVQELPLERDAGP